MSSSDYKIIRIAQESEKKGLSKAQKQFNNLIKRIDKEKQLLMDWQETIPIYNQKLNNEYNVLSNTYNDQRAELACLFDRAYGNTFFKKTDKAKIKHILTELTADLISEHGREDLKELHNKYSDSGFDADKQEADAIASELLKSMVQDMFGLEIGDEVDISSPEKMQAVIQEKMQEIQNKDAEKHRQAEEYRSKRKKTAKQLEKEAKQQLEDQNISKSIREVYRKLARALHPDREQDEKERERKTKIMQRVNAAYNKKDLLQLLELQLEVEQIDQKHLNNIAEDRLKYFNKILKEQFEELQQEILEIEQPFKMRLQLLPFSRLLPKQLILHLERDIQTVRRDISSLKRDIQTFQNLGSLKAFLKGYKIPPKPSKDDLDDLFFDNRISPFDL